MSTDPADMADELNQLRHVYTVAKVLWPEAVEEFIESLFIGRSLHVCCGKSQLGDVRLDQHEEDADLHCDAANMQGVVGDDEYDTVLCDPPYNGSFQWNHDLLCELSRVAKQRIIFQHWFMPVNAEGRWKKWNDKFVLSAVYVWQPRTYFGRVQVISVLDRDPAFDTHAANCCVIRYGGDHLCDNDQRCEQCSICQRESKQ